MAPAAVLQTQTEALLPTDTIATKLVPAIANVGARINVDVDSINPAVAKSIIAHGVQPVDMTSNQILVGAGLMDPDNRELVLGAAREYGSRGWEAVFDRISALLCAKAIVNITGRVLLQTTPTKAYDTEAIVAHARRYAAEFEKVGISKDRFCIKIPATGPALNAAPILLKEGIRTLGTSLFNVPQAIACSQAGCLYISPYYNEVKAHDKTTGLFPDVQDPSVEHPMSPRMVQIYEAYRRLEQSTGKAQPLIKGASNITANEVLGCVDMGVQHITILAPVLQQLYDLKVAPEANPVKASSSYNKPLAPRMLALLEKDPLASNPAQFKFSDIDLNVDYLANNGAELEKAIQADPETSRRIKDSLELFVGAENTAKEAVLKAMAEVGF